MKIRKAVIPAAGYATRLYPLTLNKPKTLVEIKGKSILQHLIDKIISLKSIDEIILITNHKFYHKLQDWYKNHPQKITLKIYDDQTISNGDRLGAIGDIYFGLKKAKVKESILWLSSDNLFNFDLKKFCHFFEKVNKDVVGAYDVKNLEEAKKMGVLLTDSSGKVIDFEEKPKKPKSTLCSIGIYAFTKDTVKLFDRYLKEGNSPDKPGEFIEWLYLKKDVLVFSFDSPQDKWFDIGTLDTLKLAQKEFK